MAMFSMPMQRLLSGSVLLYQAYWVCRLAEEGGQRCYIRFVNDAEQE